MGPEPQAKVLVAATAFGARACGDGGKRCVAVTAHFAGLGHILSRWNGQTAADLYRGAIAKVLAKQRGTKRKYLVLEDVSGAAQMGPGLDAYSGVVFWGAPSMPRQMIC